MISSEIRILTLEDALLWRDAWRRRDLSIGFTNGCFDVLHFGHLTVLDYTFGKCDRLIVGINSDASVRRIKGRNRPHNPERERAAMVASLAPVDCVVIFEEDTPMKLIEALEPDVLIKGGDYTVAQIVGADFVMKRGGKVYRCPLVANRSTSETVRRSA